MAAIRTREISTPPDRTQDNDQRPDRRLLAGYLHKTSNTLCGIKGYASLIAEGEDPEDKAGKWARKIIREVERMEEIFRSVGDLSRRPGHPDAGMDLVGFVADTASAWAENHPGVDLTLGGIPAGELRLPAADLALLLTEILENCAESALPTGQTVRVLISGSLHPDGGLFLEIKDDGCGMEDELAAKATHPFISTKEDHHGVGLTRVDTLMEMYGLVWTLDSGPGQGTRVRLEVGEVV
jgi:signal transduction histidine kinase